MITGCLEAICLVSSAVGSCQQLNASGSAAKTREVLPARPVIHCLSCWDAGDLVSCRHSPPRSASPLWCKPVHDQAKLGETIGGCDRALPRPRE
jgi:hypothetical protein